MRGHRSDDGQPSTTSWPATASHNRRHRRAFDGVTEVRFPSEQALITALATPAGIQAEQRLAEDEKSFIDLPGLRIS
ncbi:EthD domain-containing protein [Nocardia sp. NPDC051787]|uniref:EthD domain-containing protein n=1 Tax=Nocardia sp. NPDC051787 TaxID=3155415 RepID=UPI0034217AE9